MAMMLKWRIEGPDDVDLGVFATMSLLSNHLVFLFLFMISWPVGCFNDLFIAQSGSSWGFSKEFSFVGSRRVVISIPLFTLHI